MKAKRSGAVVIDRAPAAKIEYEKLAREWLVLHKRKHYAGGYGAERDDDFVIGLTLRMIEVKSKMNVLAKMYGHKW